MSTRLAHFDCTLPSKGRQQDTSTKLSKFGWQNGYGVNQVTQHATDDFQDEFRRLLEMPGIEYDERDL